MKKIEESLNQLKMAIKNKRPLKIWLDDTEIGIYKFENNVYQGVIGYFELETMLQGLDDGWVKAEVAK